LAMRLRAEGKWESGSARTADVPPVEVAEWGAAGPPAEYDPGAVTTQLPAVTQPGGVNSPVIAPASVEMRYPQVVVPGAELVAELSSGDGTELPHWADPPTGEVPRALAGRPGSDDEMQAWRMLGSRGLHWRDDVSDWSDGPGVEELIDGEPTVPPESPGGGDPFSFDDDFDRLERERAASLAEAEDDAYEENDAYNAVSDEQGEVIDPLAPAPVPIPAALVDATAATSSATSDDPDATRAVAVGPSSSTQAAGPGAKPRMISRGRSGGVRPGHRNALTPAQSSAQAAKQHTRRPYDVTVDSALSGGGRDVGAAVATGVGLIALLVICYVIGPGALLALAAVALMGCAFEAFSMLQRAGFRPATIIGALGSAAAVLAAYWKGPSSLVVVFVVVLVASLVWYLVRVVDARPVVNVAVTVMAFAWVGVLGSFAGLLLQAQRGEHLFLGAVVPTVVADMVAWFAGSQFGSHPLAPEISPGKTWEGLIGGAVGAVVVAAIIGSRVAPWGGIRHGIELGLVVAVAAPVGDLVQSMVKRDLRLKDSGSLLPGHGGLLDRFDSMLFVLPATYYLATVLHLVR
jgi:CDP-diglyceride synthetase